MGLLSKFENKMEDAVEGTADRLINAPISPVQIAKKCEKQMKRSKMVGAGKQFAPTLFTVLVNTDDDGRLFGYYPTLAGETETYLVARAHDMGLTMDGKPLVRFIADGELKHGKFDVIAECVAAPIIERLRMEEMQRYGIAPRNDRAAMRGVANVANSIDNGFGNYQEYPAQGGYDNNDPYNDPYNNYDNGGAFDAPSGNAYDNYDSYDDYGNANNFNAYGQQGQMGQEYAYGQQDQYNGYDNVNAATNWDNVQPGYNNDPFGEAVRDPFGEPAYPRADAGFDVPADAGFDAPAGAGAGFGAAAAGAGAGAGFGMGGAAAVAGAGFAAGVAGAAAADAGMRGRNRGNNARMDLPAAAPLEAQLYDLGTGRAYRLAASNISIGRETDNTIVVNDMGASRSHAKVVRQQNGWVLVDCNSLNGTLVNGRGISSKPLVNGDIITIGSTEYQFIQQ